MKRWITITLKSGERRTLPCWSVRELRRMAFNHLTRVVIPWRPGPYTGGQDTEYSNATPGMYHSD